MIEKTSCYYICPLGHNCFGGYLNENPQCDAEIERIRQELVKQYPDRTILFAPKSILGLLFKIIQSSDSELVVKLSNGEIEYPEKNG